MADKDKDFVHLHVHSDYSLLDGCCRMDRLMDRAVELGMSAMALTDHGNLFGAVSFVKHAEKRGIKPIIGFEGYLVTDHLNDERPGRENHKSYHLGLLAKNFEGYQNLCKVVSDAHVDGFYYRPRTDLETLAVHGEITWLYGKEELENICVQIKFKSAALARSREDELVLEEFRSNCRKLLQWTLISSPRSEIIRIGIRRNP